MIVNNIDELTSTEEHEYDVRIYPEYTLILFIPQVVVGFTYLWLDSDAVFHYYYKY